MTASAPEGAACTPNLSAGARRLRERVAWVMGVVATFALGGTIVMGAAWWVRAIVFFPAILVAAIAVFEARASVCVVGAAQGVFEDEARVKTPMDASLLPAIRLVARSLLGKAALVALLATVAASLTALLH
jgi:hypothetical protein